MLSSVTVKKQAVEAAFACLDFYVRNQVSHDTSVDCCYADNGRFPCVYDHGTDEIVELTSGWETAVLVDAILIANRFRPKDEYLEAASSAVSYLKSLQRFVPSNQRMQGLFFEVTPQSQLAHPRDASTVAWALLDWYHETQDQDSLCRAEIFAKWYIDVCLEQGYPYWTVRTDGKPWEPSYCGSFHSGTAFFFYRLYTTTGKKEYKRVMQQILDYYNEYHLSSDGIITVIVDRQTHESLDSNGLDDPDWEIMHQFNDDFGTLANLAAYKVTGDTKYRDAANRFLARMETVSQCSDGGFGLDDKSVPSAAGSILVESFASLNVGLDGLGQDNIDKAVKYLLSKQYSQSGKSGDGAILDGSRRSRARTGAYSIMGLLRYAGAIDSFYYV